MAKLGMQQDSLDTEEYFEKLGLPYTEPEQNEVKESNTVTENKNPEKEIKDAGRPTQSRDTKPRKQRRVLPRSSEPTSATLWGIEAQEKISDMMTPVICKHYGKKDSRSLSKSQVKELEHLKLSIFTSLDPMIKVDESSISEALSKNAQPSATFNDISKGKTVTFSTIRQRKPNTSEMRHIYASTFAEIFCSWLE